MSFFEQKPNNGLTDIAGTTNDSDFHGFLFLARSAV
jgi:hypothetical protein